MRYVSLRAKVDRDDEKCANCGKPLKRGSSIFMVPGAYGILYKTVVTPAVFEQEDLDTSRFTGYYPVGRDCYGKIILIYSIGEK